MESPRSVQLEITPASAWHALMLECAATHDYSELTRLSRRARKLAATPEIAARLVPVRIGIASSATFDFLLPILETALLGAGLAPTLHSSAYGQVAASLIDPDSALSRFRPQVTLVLVAPHHLPATPSTDDPIERVHECVDEACRALLDPCASFHERTGSDIVLNNFHPLPWRAAGNIGVRLPGDLSTFVRRLNLAIGDRAPRYVHINDLASLVERHGLDRWFDERYWYLAKQPVSFECASHYCRQLASVVGAILGRTRKCLVVDLDNTLWGGVIGDDGLSGIEIGEGSGVGEAYKAFQIYLRQLKDRGILLAVCSKNDAEVARSPFTEHADMQLRLEDFVAFKANWRPKSENIKAIAQQLNLGLDAFVFVDDNPAERAEVRQSMPDVAIVDLPEDPSHFVRALDGARWFEVSSVTDEDRHRTSAYQARQQSLEARRDQADMPAYLRSLEMSAVIEPFQPAAFDRITQLINKTNQFNLTTPRVVPSEVLGLSIDPKALTFTVRLRDRFADHGLISVTVGQIHGDRLEIEAWLMSCRVMGRGVEHLLCNHLVAAARERGLNDIVGIYKATSRNGMVKDHYARLGFLQVDGGLEERWRLAVTDATRFEVFISTSEGR